MSISHSSTMLNGESLRIPADDKFSLFEVTTHTYKTVLGHPILVDIHVPKRLLSEVGGVQGLRKRPVLIRIHGGWLVGGQRDFAKWCPLYALELALKHNAIVVMPDYRLLPEANGHDILDDINDFWDWVTSDREQCLRSAVRAATGDAFDVDLDRVIVEGESAGGYLAIQLALSHCCFSSSVYRIRAIIAVYPMLGLRSPHWTQAYHKQMFDSPQYPVSILDDHLALMRDEIEQGKVHVKTNEPIEGLQRGDLAIAIVQHGRFLEVLDPDNKTDPSGPKGRRLHPEERLQDDPSLVLPTAFFLHGKDDRAVPISGTDAFVETVKERIGEEKVLYARPPGDHGFENEMSLWGEDPEKAWLKEGLAFVEKEWIS